MIITGSRKNLHRLERIETKVSGEIRSVDVRPIAESISILNWPPADEVMDMTTSKLVPFNNWVEVSFGASNISRIGEART